MNRFLPYVALAAFAGLVFVVLFFWYYGSPKFLEVGYRPIQPIEYSHKLHAGDLGMDCRYCHSEVEKGRHANIPAIQTCMNCHSQVGLDNPKLAPLRESWNTNTPIEWVRVHKLPDYAYFDHSAHLRAGIGCIECHGNVREMDRVMQVKPLSMGWCLDCHRNPDPHIRPLSELTNMEWKPPANHAEFVERFKKDRNIQPREDCSTCHR